MLPPAEIHQYVILSRSFSSDSVSHTTSTKEAFERTMETVASALKVVFPPNQKDSVPVILSLGNHDVFPDNTMSVADGDHTRQLWCTRLGSSPKLWGDWIASDTDADSGRFNDGEFHAGSKQSTLNYILYFKL